MIATGSTGAIGGLVWQRTHVHVDTGSDQHSRGFTIAFARGEGTEVPTETDIVATVEDVVSGARREGARIGFAIIRRRDWSSSCS